MTVKFLYMDVLAQLLEFGLKLVMQGSHALCVKLSCRFLTLCAADIIGGHGRGK